MTTPRAKKDGPSPFTLQFAIDLRRWNADVDQGMRTRISSGRTSIRISKTTLVQLRLLIERIRELESIAHYKDDGESRSWGFSRASVRIPSPDELLLMLASGRILRGHASAAAAPAGKTHASRARTIVKKQASPRGRKKRAAARRSKR